MGGTAGKIVAFPQVADCITVTYGWRPDPNPMQGVAPVSSNRRNPHLPGTRAH